MTFSIKSCGESCSHEHRYRHFQITRILYILHRCRNLAAEIGPLPVRFPSSKYNNLGTMEVISALSCRRLLTVPVATAALLYGGFSRTSGKAPAMTDLCKDHFIFG